MTDTPTLSLPRLARSPLLGRERELAVLSEQLAEARTGHCSVVLLSWPELKRQRLLVTLEVGPLGVAASGILVARLLQAEVATEVRSVLRERSEGNPFFLEELVRTVPRPGAGHRRPDVLGGSLGRDRLKAPPIVFDHAACGGAVEQLIRCATCGETPTPAAVVARAGPGGVDPISESTRRPGPPLLYARMDGQLARTGERDAIDADMKGRDDSSPTQLHAPGAVV